MKSSYFLTSRPLGYLLTLSGGLLWALGGTCGQRVFQLYHVTADWLVPIRIFLASVILLLFSFWKNGFRKSISVFHSRRDRGDLFLFAIFGAGASQYTYYTCIQYSNAAFATVISYMFPAVILLYGIVRSRRPPKLYETISVILVILGAFACTTHFDLSSMSLSPLAILFGILAAITSAYNTVKPQRLLRTYPLFSIMGLSMVISGIVLFVLCRLWTIPVTPDSRLFLLMSVVIVGGTIFAFCFYQAGVRIVGSLAGGILASAEPIGAVLLAVLFLGVAFTLEDFLGFVLILSAVPIIALGQQKEVKQVEALSKLLSAQSDESKSDHHKV